MSAWTARQHLLLQEMGVRLWVPPASPLRAGTDDDAVPGALADGPVAAPVAGGRATLLDDAPRSMAVAAGQRPHDVPSAPAPHGAERGDPAPATPALQRARAPEAPGLRPEVEGMDWPALEAAVAGCQACGLCRSRRQTVFGVGHRQARWMLVGEAPGEQEDREGEPFVGKAGQLLDAILRALRLTRGEAEAARQVYVANVLKCRPPQNRNPLPEEVAQCEPFLRRQIALVQPQVIVAMGRFAVQSLLGSQEPIGRLRGRVHQYAGVPLVVTYHPAYLLRNPLDKSRSWEDFCLAREVATRATV